MGPAQGYFSFSFMPLAVDANEAARAADATKNVDAYAELIQSLDDRGFTFVSECWESMTARARNKITYIGAKAFVNLR